MTDETAGAASILLATANVGSIFEFPSQLLKPWLSEFLQKISEVRPQFLALHLQEVGGKTYDKSMEHVQQFIKSLCEAEEMRDFAVIRIYMDEDFNSAEHFTALGSLYFGHKDLVDLKLWNFLTHDWEIASEKSIYSGNIECVATKEKSKFPQHFFPECKWSRKGFMRTRWQLNGTVFDLVNIHLFHDASNLAACQEFPSVYCKTRRRALIHTLERFHLDDKNGYAPYFVFGDFNFRCDTEGVIRELTQNLSVHRVQSFKTDSTKFHYRNSVGDNVLTVGKKEFNHADHQLKFKEAWLKKFDRELEALSEILVEYPIEFAPSYPFEEDPEMPTDYMSTRCPSWCDRILMSPQAQQLIAKQRANKPYSLIGENICMGDHKPIYLNVHLKPNQGTYRCCKCYLTTSNNNNNKSKPALAHHSTAAVPSNELCPHKSSLYADTLSDCRQLDSDIIIANLVAIDGAADAPNSMDTGGGVALQSQRPSVSINIIDSDNICVCMCAQLRNSVDIENANDADVVDGAICSLCQHIIRRQPTEYRYRLVSKRLMLSPDIIVNRIDTQYLNAHQLRRQDPYTPESVESHSPMPELHSSSVTTTSTTTSSNNRSPYEKHRQCNDAAVLLDAIDTKSCSDYDVNVQLLQRNHSRNALQTSSTPRGIVLPGQLKSRLEDLQRSSMRDLKCDESNFVGTKWPKRLKATEGQLCKDQQVPECFTRIVTAVLGNENDEIWLEQSSAVEDLDAVSQILSNSHYVHIKSLVVGEDQTSVGSAAAVEHVDPGNVSVEASDGGGGGGGGCVSAATQFPILKETTV